MFIGGDTIFLAYDTIYITPDTIIVSVDTLHFVIDTLYIGQGTGPDYITFKEETFESLHFLSTMTNLKGLFFYKCMNLIDLTSLHTLKNLKVANFCECLRLENLSGINGLKLKELTLLNSRYLADIRQFC